MFHVKFHDHIFSVHICAKGDGKGSCFGDRGGPLVVVEDGRYTVVGVVSFGREKCADEMPYAGVYAKITARKNWIMLMSRAVKRVTVIPANKNPTYRI